MHMRKLCRLKIYLDDSDMHAGRPVYEWLVEEAHREGLRGATVVRGAMGYGGHDKIHSGRVFALSAELPVVVEIIDSREKIDAFTTVVKPVLVKGMLTIEDVDAIFFGAD